MAATNRTNATEIIRSELWQPQLEEILHEKLTGTPFVRQFDFPDGSTMTFPSIGTSLVRDLPEGTEVTFDAVDTGEVQITLDDPVVAATSISELLMEDSMWASELMSTIPADHAQSIMERYETDVFELANQQSGGQSNANLINGVAHRRIAQGTNEVMTPSDFSRARYTLTKTKMETNNLIAIVDPSVGFALENTTNLVNIDSNPRWEGIIETGIQNNLRFVRNVFGFDVFESNLLADANETIGGDTTAAGKANIFMSASNQRMLPFTIAWKRRPMMDSDFDFKLREHQIVTTARWGTGLIREENLVVILSDTDQV